MKNVVDNIDRKREEYFVKAGEQVVPKEIRERETGIISTQEEFELWYNGLFGPMKKETKTYLRNFFYEDGQVIDEHHFLSAVFGAAYSDSVCDVVEKFIVPLGNLMMYRFDSKEVGREIRYLLSHTDHSHHFDLETFMNETYGGDPGFMKNVFGYAKLFNDLTIPEVISHHKKLLSERFARECIHAFNSYFSLKEMPYHTWRELIDMVEECRENAVNRFSQFKEGVTGDELQDQIAVWASEKEEQIAVKTGISAIDNSYTVGGVLRGEMVGVVASAGSGKSLFLQNIENYALKNYKDANCIRFIISDLTNQTSFIRQLSTITHMPHLVVHRNIQEAYNLAYEISPQSFDKKRCLHIYLNANTVSAKDIRDYLERTSLDIIDEKTGEKQSVKYIDWYNIISVDYDNVLKAEGDDLYSKGGETAGNLKALSEYTSKYSGLRTLVYVAMQSTRGGSDRNTSMTLDNISESAQKGRILDSCISIQVDKDAGYTNTIGTIKSLKHRNSRGFKCYFFRDIDGNFYEMSEDGFNNLANANRSNLHYTNIPAYVGHRSEHGKLVTYYDINGNIQVAPMMNYQAVEVIKNNEIEGGLKIIEAEIEKVKAEKLKQAEVEKVEEEVEEVVKIDKYGKEAEERMYKKVDEICDRAKAEYDKILEYMNEHDLVDKPQEVKKLFKDKIDKMGVELEEAQRMRDDFCDKQFAERLNKLDAKTQQEILNNLKEWKESINPHDDNDPSGGGKVHKKEEGEKESGEESSKNNEEGVDNSTKETIINDINNNIEKDKDMKTLNTPNPNFKLRQECIKKINAHKQTVEIANYLDGMTKEQKDIEYLEMYVDAICDIEKETGFNFEKEKQEAIEKYEKASGKKYEFQEEYFARLEREAKEKEKEYQKVKKEFEESTGCKVEELFGDNVPQEEHKKIEKKEEKKVEINGEELEKTSEVEKNELVKEEYEERYKELQKQEKAEEGKVKTDWTQEEIIEESGEVLPMDSSTVDDEDVKKDIDFANEALKNRQDAEFKDALNEYTNDKNNNELNKQDERVEKAKDGFIEFLDFKADENKIEKSWVNPDNIKQNIPPVKPVKSITEEEAKELIKSKEGKIPAGEFLEKLHRYVNTGTSGDEAFDEGQRKLGSLDDVLDKMPEKVKPKNEKEEQEKATMEHNMKVIEQKKETATSKGELNRLGTLNPKGDIKLDEPLNKDSESPKGFIWKKVYDNPQTHSFGDKAYYEVKNFQLTYDHITALKKDIDEITDSVLSNTLRDDEKDGFDFVNTKMMFNWYDNLYKETHAIYFNYLLNWLCVEVFQDLAVNNKDIIMRVGLAINNKIKTLGKVNVGMSEEFKTQAEVEQRITMLTCLLYITSAVKNMDPDFRGIYRKSGTANLMQMFYGDKDGEKSIGWVNPHYSVLDEFLILKNKELLEDVKEGGGEEYPF